MKNQLSIVGNGLRFPRMVTRMRRDLGRLFDDGWPEVDAGDSLIEGALSPAWTSWRIRIRSW